MTKFSISIVIPNYNGKDLLKKNLPSVYEAITSSEIIDYEIIVPDDNSKDDSCDFIRKNYDDIILLKGTKNIGFSGNINRGIKKAKKDLILLLNSDITLTSNYFKPCLSYFNDPQTFGVMGKKLNSKTGKPQGSAKYPKIHGLKIKGTIDYKYKEQNNKLVPSFFLSGANSLVDRKKLQSMGGFNEIYNPYYGEDVDLSIRAWRIGYKCYYESNSVCIHDQSHTINKERKNKVIIFSKRNRFYLHFIHLSPIKRILWLTFTTLKFLPHFIIQSNFSKSYISFLKGLRSANESIINFKVLQEKKECYKSLDDIIKEIKNEIGTHKIIKGKNLH